MPTKEKKVAIVLGKAITLENITENHQENKRCSSVTEKHSVDQKLFSRSTRNPDVPFSKA